MKIIGIAAEFPTRVISNQAVLDLVKTSSQPGFTGDLDATLARASDLIEETGVATRSWLRPEESWYSLTETAIERALARARLKKQDVDLVIYGSIFRRLLEPGMSTMIAKAYGLERAECFDVIEACAGWLRACDLANALMATGRYKNALVINLEAGIHEGEYGHETLAIHSEEDLDWTYAALTLGECATATVLAPSDHNWQFYWESYPEQAHLCSLVLPDASEAGKMLGDLRIGEHGTKKFVCHSKKMQQAGAMKLVKILIKRKELIDQADLFIPHTTTGVETFRRGLVGTGSKTPLHSLYRHRGNIASCSFAATIVDALENDLIEPDAKIFTFMPAAGFSFGSALATLALTKD